MAWVERGPLALPPIDQTLKRVVLLMRLLGWVWMVILIPVALSDPRADADPRILLTAGATATVGAALLIVATRRGFLGSGWYVALDGALNLGLVTAGWLGDYREFITGGYPTSWLFVVAYATSLGWTIVAGVVASAVFATMHQLLELDAFRFVGSVQFIVVAAVVGWAFDSLRQRERLRLEAEQQRTRAEQDRAEAERSLALERETTARLEERSDIARRLHDSVLQTLKLISAEAADPAEVRHLARVQERELRRTISEYQSPHEDSFRARLLDALAMVEDMYRVRVEHVIRHDLEMSPSLQALVDAATEAMANAARHSGTDHIDLYSALDGDQRMLVEVRDRGSGFDPDSVDDGGLIHSIVDRVEQAGGEARISAGAGEGTEVLMSVPLG